MKPVFIIGFPRTGTTILHDILAQDPDSRAPMTWETMFPSPPPEAETFDTDPRDRARAARHRSPETEDRRRSGVQGDAPDGRRAVAGVRDDDGRGDVHAPVPQPVPGADATRTGSTTRPTGRTSTTSTAASSSTSSGTTPGDRWVLKTGAHMWGLEHLLATYPDARIVFTHRDPVKSMTSYASLTTLVREAWAATRSTRSRSPRTGRPGCSAMLDARRWPCAQRGTYPDAIFYDMYFSDFVADQFAVVEDIYAALDLPMTDDGRGAHAGVHRRQPEGQARHPPLPARGVRHRSRPRSGATSPPTSNASASSPRPD